MKNLIIVTALLVSGSALAADIGPAGCGLGNVIFGGKDTQVLAATTNGSSGSQTFGITSGTSNCVDRSGNAKLESYIEGNRVALESEAARGQGETIQALAQIMGCLSSDKVGQALKSSHTKVFSKSASPTQVSERVRETLKSNHVFCISLG